MKAPRRVGTALAFVASVAAPAAPAPSTSWLLTWTASPQATWHDEFPFPTGLPDSMIDTTLRQVVRVSRGGARLRLVLSNDGGKAPLAIGAVHVALALAGSRVMPGSDRVVRFSGGATATLPPGAPIVSDPVDLAVPPLGRLAISIHVPGSASPAGFHWDGRATAWLAPGDLTAMPALEGAPTTNARAWLVGVLVEAEHDNGLVVAIGDSITDGNGATIDHDRRWPDARDPACAAWRRRR